MKIREDKLRKGITNAGIAVPRIRKKYIKETA